MARFTSAVDSTASESTPGARKSIGSPSMGSTSTLAKNTSRSAGMPSVSSSDSPLRASSASSRRRCGEERPHADVLAAVVPGVRVVAPPSLARRFGDEAEEDVLQALPPGPEVGQRQVLLGQPGGEGGDERRRAGSRHQVLARPSPR